MKQEIRERIEQIKNGIVPSGYKSTPVGICPIEWKQIILSDVFIFKNGLNKEKEAFGTGTPIVNYTDVYKNRGLYFEKLLGKVNVNNKEIANYLVKKGDMFFTRTSETIHEIGLSSVMLNDCIDTVYSGFVLRARPKNNFLVNEFKKYCFATDIMRNEIIKKSSYTTRALTNGTLLGQVNLNTPQNTEQNKIAEILTTWDEAVELQENLISKLQEEKKALMQKLLTPQPDWKEVKLKDLVLKMKSGGTPKADNEKYYTNGHIPFMRISDLTAVEKYLCSTIDKITKEALDSSSAWIVPENSIIYSMYASIGFLVINKIELATSQAMMCIIPNTKVIDLDFLYYSLLNYQKKVVSFIEKGTQGNLNAEIIKNFIIIKPRDLYKQKEISKTLSLHDNQIELEKQLLEKYKDQRKALMQLLLTGIVRVV